MAINRHIRDYRLVEYVDERGKVRTSYEYIGEHYRYALDAANAAREKRLSLGVCIIGLLAFVGALVPNSAAMRTLYISLPFAFSVLPLGLMTDAVLSAPAPDRTLERRHADKLKNRWPAASLAAAILAGVSLAGELINLLRGADLNGGDLIFSLCAALLCACGVFTFSRRKRFAVRKV